jgi:hypothetical protein
VDTVSQLLTSISLSPERRPTIYHLVNPKPVEHDLELADFGIEPRECSYAEFRRACRAPGPRSPLHGHWPLVDHFARHWLAPELPAGRAGSASPATADAVSADAPAPPAWPGLITTTSRSMAWILRHEQTWPFSRPQVSLDLPQAVQLRGP